LLTREHVHEQKGARKEIHETKDVLQNNTVFALNYSSTRGLQGSFPHSHREKSQCE